MGVELTDQIIRIFNVLYVIMCKYKLDLDSAYVEEAFQRILLIYAFQS